MAYYTFKEMLSLIKETVNLLQTTLLKKWQCYGVLDYQRSGKFMSYLIIKEMVSLWCT